MERGFEALIRHVGHLAADGRVRVWVEFEDDSELYIESPDHFSIQLLGEQAEECHAIPTAERILDLYLGDEMEGKLFSLEGNPLAWDGTLLA